MTFQSPLGQRLNTLQLPGRQLERDMRLIDDGGRYRPQAVEHRRCAGRVTRAARCDLIDARIACGARAHEPEELRGRLLGVGDCCLVGCVIGKIEVCKKEVIVEVAADELLARIRSVEELLPSLVPRRPASRLWLRAPGGRP